MKIGKLANLANVNIETIRYYERIGLIEQPVTPEQGYREYPDKTLERVQFIKRSQELGFTLNEVANLLLLGEENCFSVQEIAEKKLANVREKLADLKRLENVLANLVTQCRCNNTDSACPIVESLLPKKNS
ncbi:Hg(II)-responsive transcriptional regulator [Moritella sp. F3]|uniref:Hg(II)-responsive transcriptional regulator n=1 Tax=Moritella sp. F3 TaxID=2718882 RepID=UPI0018E17C9F|nr:Hg(II)-responsive transcriptional regulator [Moritella sp. F3]GIC78689.1 MerR family transcriptional regulator [Moritella sp. F1]GIC81383.1 MerR family transcriptional regulator [Moritella sp. F3]